MDWDWIAAVSVFALAMAGTPGPNNMMVTASGANHGFRRTLPLISGITIGVAVIMLVVAGAGSPLVADPRARAVVKWAGVLYLLWLAWRIGNTSPNTAGATDPASHPLTLAQGALFQLVNPKLWAMVAGAVAVYGGAAEKGNPFAIAAVFAILFGIATFASTAAWTLVGVGTARFIRSERAMRLFNWTLAALLVLSLAPVLVE
ncbi:LysE family translocator (plasmid) [Phyllobacteriaceae bacterium JZ32]